MFIETNTTPNPNTMKFTPGFKIIESGIKSFSRDEDCSNSPLAQNLFRLPEVVAVFLTPDFITVTKSSESDWSYLKTIVLASIVDHFTAGFAAYTENEPKHSKLQLGEDQEIVIKIKELIETRIKPAVAQDGGDITFKDYQQGIVYVELHGSCSGCPSSTITLKSGIENMLKHYIPEILSVESI